MVNIKRKPIAQKLFFDEWCTRTEPGPKMSTDQLSVPPPAVSTRRRLSDALLQVVPNFSVNSVTPVSKLAKALTKRMRDTNNAQVGICKKINYCFSLKGEKLCFLH